jgi:polysaccharide export outer membrane protein
MKPIILLCATFVMAAFAAGAQDTGTASDPVQPSKISQTNTKPQDKPQATSQASLLPAAAQPAPRVDAASAANAVQPASSTAEPREDYIIGPSDVVTVNVWKDQALSGTLLVRPDGMISMPLLGDVAAQNLTALQLADQISSKLKKFVQNPNVTVVVTQIHSKVIYMFGEVARKGPLEMTPGMTVLEAISSAGGLTDFANKRKIYILRKHEEQRITIPVRYKEALKGAKEWDIVLQPDDKIVVP